MVTPLLESKTRFSATHANRSFAVTNPKTFEAPLLAWAGPCIARFWSIAQAGEIGESAGAPHITAD